MPGRKPESSRLNLFFILQVLSAYSDEENPLSATQIVEKINQDFSFLNASGEVISHDTVKRTLEELTDKIFVTDPDQYDSLLRRYGYFVHSVTGQPKKLYYLEHELREAEIISLKDAIEAYCYFSSDDTTDIIRKLLHFAPKKLKIHNYHDKTGEEREKESQLLYNIEYLSQLISEHKGARIKYCFYNVEKKLVVRPGYPKVVEPVDMLWSNGYYYLLVYFENHQEIVNLRIDRITDIEEAELKTRHSAADFNPIQYRHEHPIMFSGPEGEAKLLCRNRSDNSMMNMLMDVFGKNARIRRAGDKTLQQYFGKTAEEYEKEGITWLEVTVKSSLRGIELWAMQYGNECRLIAPEESVKRVRESLQEAQQLYLK